MSKNDKKLTTEVRTGVSTERPSDVLLRIDDLAYRTMLAYPKCNDVPPTVLITSAREGEGKTTLACALAFAIARLSGEPVLLADANPYRPALQQRFELPSHAPSMFSILRGDQAALDSVTSSAREGKTTVLPVGETPDPALLFRESSVRRFQGAMIRYRCLVLDGGTAHLGGGSLAQHVDGVILVIDSSSTRREVVQGSIAGMRLPAGRLAGTVLNRRVKHIPKFFYRSL